MAPWIDLNQCPGVERIHCYDQGFQDSIAHDIGDDVLNSKLEDTRSCRVRCEEQGAEIQIVGEDDMAALAGPSHDGGEKGPGSILRRRGVLLSTVFNLHCLD